MEIIPQCQRRTKLSSGTHGLVGLQEDLTHETKQRGWTRRRSCCNNTVLRRQQQILPSCLVTKAVSQRTYLVFNTCEWLRFLLMSTTTRQAWFWRRPTNRRCIGAPSEWSFKLRQQSVAFWHSSERRETTFNVTYFRPIWLQTSCFAYGDV